MSMIDDRTVSLDRMLLAREVEDFFYQEAELLDQWRYEEWLDLLTEDVRYWMPLARNVRFGEQAEAEYTRELDELAWFDEGKAILTLRVQQLMTGIHWAEEPLSRVSHLITNVHLTDAKPSYASPEEVTARSRFLVYRNRLEDETDFYVGKREDVLRRVDGRWKIAVRRMWLDQNVLLPKNLTILF
jgi:3-phenylpropionate/cinnamic acid dioxygenase small subunit